MKLLRIIVLLVCFRSALSQAITCCNCADVGGGICPLNDPASLSGYTCCCNSITYTDTGGGYCNGDSAHDGCTDCSGPALAPALLTPSGQTCCDCSSAGGVCSITGAVSVGSYNCCCDDVHDNVNNNGNGGQYCDTSGLAGSRHGACVDCSAPAPAPMLSTPTFNPAYALAPSNPTPSSPTPFSPTPITPVPTALAPSNPAPTAPVPTAPAPSNPAPTAPVPTAPVASSAVSVVQPTSVCLVAAAILAGVM